LVYPNFGAAPRPLNPFEPEDLVRGRHSLSMMMIVIIRVAKATIKVAIGTHLWPQRMVAILKREKFFLGLIVIFCK
jgi:hypothetical protein